MSLRNRLRAVLVCVILQVGTFGGVPMRPEQVQELMRQMNQPTLAHVLRSEREEGDGTP